MCGFPLTRSRRHAASTAAPPSHRHGRLCVCCYPRHCPPPPHRPSLPFPRSNGSRGVPSGILLTTFTHTHTLSPRCRCAQNTLTHIYICIYIHTCVRASLYSRRPLPLPLTPRHGHVVGTKVPCIALLAYRVVPLPSASRHTHTHTHRSTPPHTHIVVVAAATRARPRPSGATGPPALVRATRARARTQTANVYNRVLPGTCSPPRFKS